MKRKAFLRWVAGGLAALALPVRAPARVEGPEAVTSDPGALPPMPNPDRREGTLYFDTAGNLYQWEGVVTMPAAPEKPYTEHRWCKVPEWTRFQGPDGYDRIFLE